MSSTRATRFVSSSTRSTTFPSCTRSMPAGISRCRWRAWWLRERRIPSCEGIEAVELGLGEIHLVQDGADDAGIVLEQQIDRLLGQVDPGLEPLDDDHRGVDAARQHAPVEAGDDGDRVDHDEIVVRLR